MSEADQEYDKVYNQVKRCLIYWIHCRQNTILKLRQLARRSVSEHWDVDVANICGKSITLIGTGLTIAGFTASFFTFGASHILSAVGKGIRAFGGVTSASSNLALNCMSNQSKADAEKVLKLDNNALTEVLWWLDYWKRYCKLNNVEPSSVGIARPQEPKQPQPNNFPLFAASKKENIGQHNTLNFYFESVKNIGIIGKSFGKDLVYSQVQVGLKLSKATTALAIAAAKAAGTVVDHSATTAFANLGLAGRISSIGGNVVSMVFLPVDTYSLIKSICNISSGTCCKLSVAFTNTAKNLEEEMPQEQDTDEIVNQLLLSVLD